MVIIISTEPSALIGRQYIPRDNSYIQNKRDKSWASLFACPNLRIISEPYSERVGGTDPLYKDYVRTFIDVIDILSREKYRVMYSPAWVQ